MRLRRAAVAAVTWTGAKHPRSTECGVFFSLNVATVGDYGACGMAVHGGGLQRRSRFFIIVWTSWRFRAFFHLFSIIFFAFSIRVGDNMFFFSQQKRTFFFQTHPVSYVVDCSFLVFSGVSPCALKESLGSKGGGENF